MLSSNKPIGLISTAKKVIVILLCGIVLSAATIVSLDRFYLNSLVQRSQVFSLSVSPTDVRLLKNTALPDSQVPVDALKKKLAALRDTYDDIRFVYIMDARDQDVHFLVDSEPVSSDSHSPRGEAYPDASDQLKGFFKSGHDAFIEGPVKDEYGTWYSAIAPIVDDSGAFIAAVGVDIASSQYAATIYGLGSVPIVIAIIAALATAFYDISRKRRLETLRFQVGLLSIASHELRTPLTGIRWGTETLLQDSPTESQKKMLDSMHSSTLRLQDSIEEILQFASTGISSSNQVSTVMLNLATIVEEVVESQRLSARRRGVEFVFDQSWRAMAVQVDKVRMRRVFNNLISNAVKYANPSTPVELSAEKINNMFVVRIKNYGIGIPKQDMAHIFDGFYRGSNVIKNEINGTGMGLFMSRSIIEQHKGHITIESVENESTTVQVTLPAAIETRVS